MGRKKLFDKSYKSMIPVIILVVITLAYVVFKAFVRGVDIDYYLFAARGILRKEEIYDAFLYSPLFALLLSPLSFLPFSLSRLLWAMLNYYLLYLLWKRCVEILEVRGIFQAKLFRNWAIAVLLLSAGYLNHIFILGQSTILILWLTVEGLFQLMQNRKVFRGSLLIAMGISFKIVPLLAVFYLFLKGKIKSVALIMLLFLATLLLPAVFLGFEYNLEIHKSWIQKISPTQERYLVEIDPGTISLNAIIPKYFSKTEIPNEPGLPGTTIIDLTQKHVVFILQAFRIILVLSFVGLVFYRRKHRQMDSLWFYWELSYLAILTLLIFPHQQKYTMLYSIPAASYFLVYFLLLIHKGFKAPLLKIIICTLALFAMFFCAILGRDIVGDKVTDLFGHLHLFGIVSLIYLPLLFLLTPEDLSKLISKSES